MKTLYLYSASSICNQNTFGNPGFSASLIPVENQNELQHPDYKNIIPPLKLRRLSKLSQMAIANALSAMEKAGLKNVSAIITATGLGSLNDTENFLQKFITAGGSLVAPLSFIQSGHNTVAGQIAHYLENNEYNMTHVQQHLCFENALMDALLFVDENNSPVLIGAMDEKTEILSEMAEQFGLKKSQINKFSEGTSFFIAGPEKSMAIAKITAVETHANSQNHENEIINFLKQNHTKIKDLDHVLIGNTFEKNTFSALFSNPLIYTDYCGHYFSSSAFGCHLAVDLLVTKSYKKILIINTMKTGIGLMLIARV